MVGRWDVVKWRDIPVKWRDIPGSEGGSVRRREWRDIPVKWRDIPGSEGGSVRRREVTWHTCEVTWHTWQWGWVGEMSWSDVTYLAVSGSSRSPCWTSSTSTWSSVWYLRTVLEHKSTRTSSRLWGASTPLDGQISNSRGAASGDDVPWVCWGELVRLRTDGRWPSCGTRRWNVIGTSDKLLRVHVRLVTKPATRSYCSYC